MTNSSIFICGINRIHYKAQKQQHRKTSALWIHYLDILNVQGNTRVIGAFAEVDIPEILLTVSMQLINNCNCILTKDCLKM